VTDQPTVRRPRRGIRLLAVLVSLLTASVFVAACSDDSSSGDSSSEQAPEDVKAPMAAVLTKLPTMVELGDKAKGAASDGDFDAASDEYEELHEIWEEVEGTVKDTDADLYERIETAQGLIKDGAESKNAERVASGADAQATAVRQFVDANQ